MQPNVSDLIDKIRNALGDRYTVERELGRGGMSIVFRALDVRHARVVAVKVLRPEIAATVGADRFLREIRIAARLQHPSILPLYDSGQVGSLPFYVMPYIEGESLRERLKREKSLPIPEALRIAGEIAGALDHAHAQGVVHRDVKPENILLSSTATTVTDFGVARAIAAGDVERMTEAGIAVGTPGYMSPEQARGEADLDGRSDLYSLGCILFEMLSGEPPFTGPTSQAVLARHIYEPPRSICVVRPSVPPELDDVVRRTLAKNPVDRFPDARSLAKALQSVGDATSLTRLRARRRVIRLTIGLIVVIGVLSGVWFAIRPELERLDDNKVVVFPLAEHGSASSGDGYNVALMLGAALEHAEPLKWIDGRQHLDERQRENPELLSPGDARRISHDRRARYILDGVVRKDSDSVAVILRLHDVAGDSLIAQETATGAASVAPYQLALVAARRLLPRLLEPGRKIDLAPLSDRNPAAIALFLHGEREYRRTRFDTALTFYQRAVAEDSTLALAAIKGAQAANWMNSRGEAQQLVQLAVSHDTLLPPRYRAYARGLQAYLLAKADTAVTWLEQALVDDPQWEEALTTLGDVFYHLFTSRASQDSIAKAMFEAAFAADSSFTPPMLHLAEIAVRDGDVPRATLLLNRLRQVGADTTLVRQRALMLDCVERGPERVDWQAAAYANVLTLLNAAQFLSVAAAQPECAAAGFRAVLANASEYRLAAVMGLQGILAAQGRTRELIAVVDSAVAEGLSQALRLYVIDLAAGLTVDVGAAAMEAAARNFFGDDYVGAQPKTLWLLGLWHTRRRDVVRVERLYAALAAEATKTRSANTALMRDALAAQLALLRADTTQAIAILRGLKTIAGTDVLTWDEFEPLAVERFTLANLLLRVGQYEEALRVAEVFDHSEPAIFLPFIPGSLDVRLQAAEKFGYNDLAESYRVRKRSLARR